MRKTILIAAVIGLIVSLAVRLLLISVPAIGNFVPDGWEAMIVGALAGGIAGLAVVKFK